MEESANLLRRLSTHFLICDEKISGNGEDSGIEAYNEYAGLLGVFDGCGGLGAMAYPLVKNKTGAYLSSRTVCAAVRSWFEVGCKNHGWKIENLKNCISDYLEFCTEKCGNTALRIKGTMVRKLPTTMAAVVVFERDGKLLSRHIWAGDSRTYLLTSKGLMQVSADDINGEDAMSNLSGDGVLTNVISADGKFELHERRIALPDSCLVLAATDGCFGYLSSPMEFELILLDTMMRVENVKQWKELLAEELGNYSEDDDTLALAAWNYCDFETMKSNFCQRYESIKKVVSDFQIADEQGKLEIWHQYRRHYERFRNK